MSDNKFIQRLKGEQTPKSVVEIQNDKLVAPFTGVPHSTDVVGSIIDDKDSSVVTAKGAQNWKLDGSSLVVASSLSGDGADYTGEFNASGSGLWINATCTLPDTIFHAGTKWVLKLCGKNLLTTSGKTIGFTMVVKVGGTHITTKMFTVAEGANVFCRQLVIDFSESEQAIIRAQSGDSLTVQLLCADANASATIYNGMTVLTALQRKVDGDVVSSNTRTFDELEEDFDDLKADYDQFVIDTQTSLNGKVNIDGSSIMTAPLKFMAGSMRGAVGPYLNGVGFWKLDSQANLTLIATISDSQLLPTTTNAITLGSSTKKWKDLYLSGKAYVATLNNGADLTVPNKSGTLATMGDVELAARSGRMLTDQGKWYAKMYSATTVPTGAEYDGRNYADFSQVDGDNNPIIVIYEGQSGAWVQSEIITPPAEYDGYVSITSKIWDIVEQAGQQGGRVLWNHTSKEFTPEPRIISTNDIEITGTSTVIMPLNPSGNQIVNKDYVDSAIAAIPTPTVDIAQSIDAEIVGTLTVASNGDVSGLDSSNYLVYPGTLDMSDASSFEMVFAFTTANAVSSAYILTTAGMGYGSEHDTAITINSSEKLYFYVNASSDTITGTTTIQPNTKYYVKVVCDGTNYIMSLSEDGNNWNVEGSVLVTEKPGFLLERKYVIGRSVASVFSAMHMKECYIKENGILVWQGMDAPGLHQRVAKGHEVIAFQPPTANNNYTWYRKYADGWVEQGGILTGITNSYTTITIPVEMADTNYTLLANTADSFSGSQYSIANAVSTTEFQIKYSGTGTTKCAWQVSGIAAS